MISQANFTGNYSIPHFCKDHGISRAFFYILLKKGEGPKTFTLGTRRLITSESAARWRQSLDGAA